MRRCSDVPRVHIVSIYDEREMELELDEEREMDEAEAEDICGT